MRKSTIAHGRTKLDLTTHPRYRTTVTDGTRRMRVDRFTYSFEINKRTGIVDRAILLDVETRPGCAFGDLEIVDTDGVAYRQSWCRLGSVEFRDENTFLYWSTTFSPLSNKGKKLPLKITANYQFYKLGGLVTARYQIVEGSVDVKRVAIRNSPGALPVNLEIAHSAFFLDNNDAFNDTLSVEVDDTRDGVIASGKIVAPLWTNGRIGFNAMALRGTWNQMKQLDAKSDLKRTVIRTRDGGRRAIDFFFVNTDSAAKLEPGDTMACGFAFLPFQRYQPRLPLVDGTIDLTAQFRLLDSGEAVDEQAVVRNFRRSFWAGGIFTGTGLAGAAWTPHMFAVTKEPYHSRTKRILELARASERVLGTAHCIVNNFPGIPGYGPHKGRGGMEEGAALPEFLSAMKREGFVSLSTPEVRDYWLDVRTSTLDTLDVDGDYEDLHAHIDVGGRFDSQVEGELQYLEGIALLHEKYGREKIIIAHQGNILTVADGLNGATWPGEPWTGQNFKEMPRAVLETLLNPFLIGVDVSFYGMHHIYDLGSQMLCKQLLRNAVVPQFVAVKSDAARRLWNRYFVPGRTFRTDRSTHVSWRDPSSRDFVRIKGHHRVNLYYRAGEAYATLVHMGGQSTQPRIRLNVARLGIDTPEVFIFNVIERRLQIAKVEKGWVRFTPHRPSVEPFLFYVKQKPDDAPTVVWSHHGLRFEKMPPPEVPTGAMAAVKWNYSVPVSPLEEKEVRFWLYFGGEGRIRSMQPFGRVYVERFHAEQKSTDLVFKIPPATQGGPMGSSGVMEFNWNKSFQLSFPVLGE